MHAHRHTHTERCRLAFRVHCVSWKIGLKAEPVARQRLCHIWCFFFSLCCSLHQQCLLCPWHLNAIRYKFLPTSAVHSSADIFAWSCLPCETLFLPLQFACTYIKRLNIFLLTHCETYSGTENKRKIRVSRQKKERAQMKKMQRNFEHVAYTWWLFLFMHAYSLMSHNCRLVFRPTHHSHSTYTQNPRYRKVHVS